MVTLLTIQILSIAATTITNIIGIFAFSGDYWSIIIYDLVKLRSYTQWILLEEIHNGNIRVLNDTNQTNLLFTIDNMVFGLENNLILFKIHKGIFRQCNYLSENIRTHLDIPICQPLKSSNNQYDDLIHGMINPGRELIRKYEKILRRLNIKSQHSRSPQYRCIMCNTRHPSPLHLYTSRSNRWYSQQCSTSDNDCGNNLSCCK